MLPARATVRAQKTRAAILEAALRLFKKQGFSATTMRDVAEGASMAVGAAYYHFRTKDEIVFAFYESTLEDSEVHARQSAAKTKKFDERLRDIIECKLKQLAECREFLGQLASHALVPQNPLSPFSEETKSVRVRAIAIFEEAIRGSDLKVAEELAPHLPRLLWLYQMSVILFWLHDSSTNQKRTKKFLSLSQSLLLRCIALSRIPILRQMNRPLLELLGLFAWEGEKDKRRDV